MSTPSAATPEPTRENPFRSDTMIAEGRRERLLARRREELSDLPDAVRSAYVARAARSASALVVSLFMLTAIAAAALPAVCDWVASLMPGRNPAVLSSLLFAAAIGGSLAFFLARARAERRFASVMARATSPTADLHADVERLSQTSPRALGHAMARRHELASIALPMLAAAVLIPFAAIYTCMALVEWGYPRPAAFDDTLFAFAPQLVGSALLGMAAATLVAPRLLRLRGNRLVQLRNTAFVVLVPTFPLTIWGLVTGASLATWSGGVVAALSLLAVLAAQRVQSERALLGIADEVTVAELTLRDLLVSARSALSALPGQLNPFTLRQRLAERRAKPSDDAAEAPATTAFSRPLPKMIAAACTAAILATVAYSSISPVVRSASAADASSSRNAIEPPSSQRLIPIAHGSTTVRTVADENGERDGLVVEIQFRNGDPAEWRLPLAQPGAGFGWRFAVSVTLVDADGNLADADSTRLLLTPFVGADFSESALPLTLERPVAVFNKLICSEDLGLGLRVVPQGDWAEGAHTVRLRYEPFMSLADDCAE